ncbi:phage tail protein [Halopseudomonas pachastrellae]|nr:phage tail protein [Halopseudomonas pachastrellae]
MNGATPQPHVYRLRGEPDVIAVALFAWLRVHQLELLQNLDQAKQAVRFEAELLSNKMVDLASPCR